jgi:outer membrane protein TolC
MKLVLFLGLVAVLPAHAGPMADALEHAWARHPLAGADPARQEEARARAELAAATTPGPATVSMAHLNDRLGSDRGRQELEVELAVPLWLPGQKAARGAEADAALAEVSARRQALRLQLAGDLREAWWAMAAAREAHDLARHRLVGARGLESEVLRRHQAGDLSRVDANLARNERLAAEAEAIEADAAQARAEQAWRALTGLPAPTHLPAETPVSEDRDTLRGHPRLDALATAARLAQARLKSVLESRRDAPALAMRLVRERSDANDPYGNSLGVRLSIPFSGEARVRQDSAAARAEAAQAEAELALARQGLEQETARARREIDAAERQSALAAERRALIADNLSLAEKSFALGETDLASLLRARATARETEAAQARSRIARDAAFSRLRQALGVLP